MKELEALMNALNERCIPEALRMTAKKVLFPKTANTQEEKQKLLNNAVRLVLIYHFGEDENLRHLFSDFAYEFGMYALIKELNIETPENL